MTAAKDMDRPSRREVRRRDRRKTILDVAARSFLENGYAGTSMSGIAAMLGGSKGTLWNYFPSKEELFAAVLEERTTSCRETLTQILDPCGKLESTLHRLGTNLLEKVTAAETVALHRLVVAEAGRFPEMGTIFYEQGPLRTRMLIAEFLKGAMEGGLLRRADPLVAARTFMMLLLSNCHQLLLLGQIKRVSAAQIEADVTMTLDCFLRAYAPEGSEAVH